MKPLCTFFDSYDLIDVVEPIRGFILRSSLEGVLFSVGLFGSHDRKYYSEAKSIRRGVLFPELSAQGGCSAFSTGSQGA